MDRITEPGVRFRMDNDGIARRVPTPSVQSEVMRLSNLAAELGYSRAPSTGSASSAGTAATIARYTALADEIGIGSGGSIELPSLGRG